MTITNKGQGHRAAGAMLGMAVGDALGAPYEFGAQRPGVTFDGTDADMVGGGSFGWERGEWTDDTSMGMPILRAVAEGQDLLDESSQDGIGRAWAIWARTAPDVGIQTSAVLNGAVLNGASDATAAQLRERARLQHERDGRSGGNGSVMRTAPVGFAYLAKPDGLERVARAANEIAALTHWEDDARDAAALWSGMIHLAVRDGGFEVAQALDVLSEPARARWDGLLGEADGADPDSFQKNGWVVHAVQAAWAAIRAGGLDPADRATHTPEAFRQALNQAVDIHNDTDTVAAIAGGLAGALVGAQAIPLGWTRRLHGWGGEGRVARANELTRLALLATRGGRAGDQGWPAAPRYDYAGYGRIDHWVRHPHDEGVLVGAVGVLDDLPAQVDAVVSMCRLGTEQVPERIGANNRQEVWLIDSESSDDNPHLGFALEQAASAVAAYRAEGKTVYLHCVQAISRTPTVAALYAARHRGVTTADALAELQSVLPSAVPNPAFRSYLDGVAL